MKFNVLYLVTTKKPFLYGHAPLLAVVMAFFLTKFFIDINQKIAIHKAWLVMHPCVPCSSN